MLLPWYQREHDRVPGISAVFQYHHSHRFLRESWHASIHQPEAENQEEGMKEAVEGTKLGNHQSSAIKHSTRRSA